MPPAAAGCCSEVVKQSMQCSTVQYSTVLCDISIYLSTYLTLWHFEVHL